MQLKCYCIYLGTIGKKNTIMKWVQIYLLEFCTAFSFGMHFTGKCSAEKSLCPTGRAEYLPHQEVRDYLWLICTISHL